MEITSKYIEESTLEDFADKHGLRMQIQERGKGCNPGARYWASFESAEIRKPGTTAILSGAYGDGDTPDEAMENYCREISEELLIVDAYRDSRREIQVPRITSVR